MPNEFDAALSTFRPDPEALKSARLRQRKSDRELIQEGYEEQARLNEERAKEQERAAEEQAREQERRQKEQARIEEQRRKDQIAAQNNANEPIYRQQGRPTYTDSEGRIKPVDDDVTWQAKQEEKRLEQEQKAQARADAAFRKSEAVRLNQAEDKLESGLDTYKQAGSIASQAVQAKAGEISTLTAQAKALEESAVTEQDLARLDAIRQRLEAARNEKAQLEDNERTLNIAKTNREIELAPERRALQQQRTALPIATAPKLDGVRQASVDVPNPSPTPASQDPARTAAVLRDHITILREKGDFARAEALEKRLTNPEAWNAEQAAFRAKATPEALVQSIEEQAPQITERHAAIRQQYAGLKQQQQSYVDRLTAAEQENQRLLAGSYSDADTVTVTDQNTGETSVWHKTALQAYHQAATGLRQWEQANRGQIDLLDIEQQQLAVDAVNLEKHQRALAAKQREAQRDQDARQTQALNRLRQEPGMAAFADEIEQETAAARQRSADIARKYADPKLREIALNALNDDMQRSQADRAQRMEAKRAEAASLYNWGKELNVTDWLNEKDVSARLRQEAEKRGLTEQEGRILLDTARKLDWSRPMTGPAAQGDLRGGKSDPANVDVASGVTRGLNALLNGETVEEPVRVLANGRLTVNPALNLDRNAYTQAVQAANTTPEAKKEALKDFERLHELAGAQAAATLETEVGPFDFNDWRTNKLQSDPAFARKSLGTQANEFIAEMKQRPAWQQYGDTLLRKLAKGVTDVSAMVNGAASLATGFVPGVGQFFGDAATANLQLGEAIAGSTSLKGGSDSFALRAGGLVAELIPQIVPMMVGGGLLTAGGRMGAVKAAAILGGVQTTGLQQASSYMALRQKGLSHFDAWKQSAPGAIASGIVTGLLTALGGRTGGEATAASLLTKAGREASMKAFKDSYSTVWKGLKTISGHALGEYLEEAPDELFSQISEEISTKGREANLGKVIEGWIKMQPELMTAVSIMGGGMGTAADLVNRAAMKDTILAEDVAAAETEIEAFQDNRYDSSVNDQIRSRASLALAISRGLDLNAVDESILNAAGWTRKDASGLTRADGTLSKLKNYQGPAVLEVDTKGRVKLDSKYAANLKEHMPTLAGLIGKRVLDWHTPGKIEEAAPASANSPTAQAPATQPAASSGEVSAAPQAAPPKPRGSSAQGAAPAAASAGGKTEAAAPAVSGAAAATTSTSPSLPVSQSPDSKEAVAALLPSYTDPADPRPQRAWEIANHLEMAGMPRADANKVAANAIRFQGIVGKTVNEHVTSEAFEKFLDEQGVTGDRSTREGTEPLRLASQPASSQTPASPAPASQEPKSPKPASTKPAKPEPKNGRPEYPALRQQLAAREMSTIEALREVVRLSGEHDTGVLQDILTDHLGLKKPAAAAAVETLRAQGELTGAPNEDISLASSKRKGSGKRFQPSDDFAPADSRDLGRSTAFARHRLAALASLPPRARRWGYRYISSLEPMLAQNAAIFEAVQIGPMARRNLGGQQIAVMNQGGKITLLIDLPAMMRNVSDLGDPRRRAAATLDEETWHAAQLHLEKSQPEKWNRDTLAQQWQDLPTALKQQVWNAYHNAGNRPLPAQFSTNEAYAMQSEFLRMLGQGQIDPSAITEAVDPSSGLMQSLRDLLADLYNILRKLIAGLPPSQAQTLDQQVQELQTVRSRLLQPGPPSPDALAKLQILRDPVAVGQMALQNGMLWQDLESRDSLLTPQGRRRVWDLLSPEFKQAAEKADPDLAQARTPEAKTKRLLEILLDPAHARSLAQTLLQPGQPTQTSTSVVRRVLSALGSYFRSPPKPTFDRALGKLDVHSTLVLAHLRSLITQARAEFEAAAGVQTVSSASLQQSITAAAMAGVNTQDQEEVRANLRRTAQQSAEAMQAAWAQEAQQRAFFDAANALAEQMMPGVSDALQRAALARQITGQSWEALKARMQANLAQVGAPAATAQPSQATPPLALPSPAMRSAQAIQELLTDRDNLAQQNTSPAAREEIARRLLQEEWSAAILQVAAQAERRYYANAGELSPADQRQIEALLQVVRGDLTLGWQADRRQIGTTPDSGTPIRMMGLARENALNALGITIEPDGTAWADAKAPIYIERGQILIKQSTLDDLATRLPITRRQFRRSELEQRADANLTGAPSPVTADSIAQANAERAQAITERRQAARLDALEQADREEISEDEAESGPLYDPIADPQTGRLSPGERGDLISWLATEGSLGWPDASQGGEWDWLKPYLDEYYTFESSRTRTKILKDKQGNSIGAVEQAVTGTKLGITNSHKNAARQGRLTHPGAVVEWLIQQGILTPAVETRETRDLSPHEGIREGTGLDAVQDAAEAAGYDMSDGIGNAVLAALEARKAARRDRKADPQTALELQTLRFERDTRSGPVAVEAHQLAALAEEGPTYVTARSPDADLTELSVLGSEWQPMDPDSREIDDYLEGHPAFRGLAEGQPERLMVTLSGGTLYGRQTIPGETILRVHDTGNTGIGLDLSDTGDFLDGAEPTEEPMDSPEADIEAEMEDAADDELTLDEIDPEILAEAQSITLPDDPETLAAIKAEFAQFEASLQRGSGLAASHRWPMEQVKQARQEMQANPMDAEYQGGRAWFDPKLQKWINLGTSEHLDASEMVHEFGYGPAMAAGFVRVTTEIHGNTRQLYAEFFGPINRRLQRVINDAAMLRGINPDNIIYEPNAERFYGDPNDTYSPLAASDRLSTEEKQRVIASIYAHNEAEGSGTRISTDYQGGNAWLTPDNRYFHAEQHWFMLPDSADYTKAMQAGFVRVSLERGADKILWAEFYPPLSTKKIERLRTEALMKGAELQLDPDRTQTLAASDRRPTQVEPGFYSTLAEVIRAKMPNRADARTLRGLVENPQTRIKAEELKWSGLLPWADSQPQPLTRQQVLDFLDTEGRVKFTVTRLQPIGPQQKAEESLIWDRQLEITDQIADLRQRREEYGLTPSEAFRERLRLSAELSALDDQLNNLERQIAKGLPRNTKWTLPGGTNPQEVVVTWKQPGGINPDSPISVEMTDDGDYIATSADGTFTQRITGPMTEEGAQKVAEYLRAKRLEKRSRRDTTPNTDSDRTHYGDLDALAWFRTNDRTDANGQAGLFVEEFQSKWHQQGREKGYQGERNHTVVPDPVMPGQMWLVQDPQGNTVNFGATEEEAQRWADAYTKESGGVPDAPYRKDWPLMLFKRALADAVAAGKAWIGWTVGDTQAERYDLSKQVSKIGVTRTASLNYSIDAMPTDGGRYTEIAADIPAEKLTEYVGKELAAKIIQRDIAPGTNAIFTGLDLKVGGEGMRKFYDDMLVKEFGKYVKQWGGKVEQSSIETQAVEMVDVPRNPTNGPSFVRFEAEGRAIIGIEPNGRRIRVSTVGAAGEANSQIASQLVNDYNKALAAISTPIWKIAITPQMRASVAQGQPLFARNRLNPQMLGQAVQLANNLIEKDLITDFGKYVKAASDEFADDTWKQVRPYLAGVWDIAATLNNLPIPERSKARQLIAAFGAMRPARQPAASSTPRPSQARPAPSLPQPSADDLWKAGMDPEIIAQITGTRPPEPTQADNTAAAAAELAALAEKTAETGAPSIFALPAEPDAPAMPDSPEERMEAGWNAHPEDEQLPNAPLIAKGDLDAAKPVNIQGGKSSLLSRGIYNRAIAALARHSTAIGDMFFGTGTVTQYIHKAGLGKPGGHASEYSPWRASFLRQVTDPAKVEALAQGARAGIEELKRVQEAARTAVTGATDLEQAMKGFAGFINSLDHSTLSPNVWNAIRQRALAGYHISLKDKNYSAEEFELKIEHFARVHGLKARVMIGMYQALPAGFDLAAYKAKVEAAIAWDKHLLATRDGQVAMFAPPQAEHPGPIPARDDPASTGLYIAAEMLSDNGISLDLATETKEIDVIGKNGKPQKKKVQILTDRLNEPFTGLFDDWEWHTSDRAQNIEKLIRDYHQVFVGKTIHSANSWMLLPRLALENPGIGFVIDPPYFGVPETENGSVVIDANTGQPVRKGTSNYDSTTDIRTPDDLLRLFDSFVLPAWQSGAKFVLTNEWDDSAAVALRLRGATVVKIARQGRKGDTPELVAYNFNPTNGALRPHRGSTITPSRAFNALQRGAYPGASHSGNLDPRLKLAARAATEAEPEAARVALQQRQDAAQLPRGNAAGRSDRPVGADQRPAPRAPTVERTMAPLPPGADATPLERAQWDREQARLKADLRDAGDSNAQLDVLYDNLDTPSQFRPMPWDEARDLLLSLRPGDRMIDPTGTRSRPVVKIEPIMQTKNGGTMYGIWLEGATQPTRLREYIRMMSEGELAIERQQDIARKEASDRILAQLMGEGIELTAEQVRQADILKASLRQTFPNVPPPTTQEIRQILAAAPRFQVSPSPRLQVSSTPSQALVIYRRLTAERDRLAQEGRNLTPDQAQRLEQAERQLGQVMMDFLPPPTTPDLRLESEPTRTRDLNRTPTAEQLRLFASARITEPPFATPEQKALEDSRIHAIDTLLHGQRRPIAQTSPSDVARSSRSQLQALLSHLRRGQRTGGPPAGDEQARQAESRRSDKALLIDWARNAGVLLGAIPARYQINSTANKGGSEHHVFHDTASGRWVKITKGDGSSFGYQPLDEGKNDEWMISKDPADLLSYLEKLTLHNQVFHDDIVLHGVVADPLGKVALIISQPDYQGTFADAVVAIQPAMEAAGFVRIEPPSARLEDPSAYYRPADNIAVIDLHDQNAVLEDNGTFLRVFDNIMLQPSGALRATFERLAAQNAKPGLASAPRTPAQTIEATGLAPAISVKGTAYTGSPGLFHGGILADYVWRKVFTPQQRRDDPDKKQASKFAHEEWMDSRGSGFDDFGFLDTRSGKFLTREEAYTLLTERGFTTPPESYSTRYKSLDSSDLFWSQPTTTPLPASERLAQAAQKTNTTPTEAQKQAENYQTGKVSVHGLRLSIENPRGSVRRGTDANGKAWEITMPHHYGRILGTHGADKDHVDFFMGPDPDSPTAFVINQRKPGNGHFDEHKVMLGFTSAGLAARGYLDSYTKGWTGYQSIVPMTFDQLKHWLEHGKMDQPVTLASAERHAKAAAMADSPKAAQTSEPSPGGLSEAESLRRKQAIQARIKELRSIPRPSRTQAQENELGRLEMIPSPERNPSKSDKAKMQAEPWKYRAPTLPSQAWETLQKWPIVSKSPHSFSYYDITNKSWGPDPDGHQRISDHWNYNGDNDTFYDPNKLHGRTDVAAETLQGKWALGIYDALNRRYNIVATWDKDEARKPMALALWHLQWRKKGQDGKIYGSDDWKQFVPDSIYNARGGISRKGVQDAIDHVSRLLMTHDLKQQTPTVASEGSAPMGALAVADQNATQDATSAQGVKPIVNPSVFPSPRLPVSESPSLAASPREALDTLSRASFNHLDRKLVTALRRAEKAVTSQEPVQATLQAIAAWKGKDTPSHHLVRSLADLAQRELIPETVLPREILSALRELQTATSIGQQKALDLSRAALGKVPKFSDLAFPAEYVENPAWRETMFTAMEQGKVDTLPEPLQKMAGQLRALLVEAGREAVAQGRMSPDTFEGLRTTYMPRFTKDEAEAGAGDWTKRFKLGIKDILAQRSTAFHITDTTRKGKDGLPLLINHHGRKWRFADAQARDAYYEELIQRETLEPDLGNTDWSWMTRRDSRLLHTVTPEMLKAPATMTADQRAIVARVQRQLRQQFKKEDPYEPKDLIKDPVYAVMRYLAQMTHDNATAKFFNLIEKNPDWTTTTDTAGFTQIPDSTRFGTLAGKWVRKDIAQQVVELADSVHQALQLWDAIIRLWKTGKTVLNSPTHGRNIIGNIPFAIFAGNNPLNPGNWPTYIKAFRILREGGAEYRQLYESGVLGADYAGTELKAALQTIIPGGEDLPKSSNPVLAQIQAITKRAADWADAHSWKNLGAMAAAGAVIGGITSGPIGAVYGAALGAGANKIYRGLTFAYRFEDDIFKAAAFIKARMMGMSIEQAAEHVRHWFPYYDKPTSFTLRQLGRTGLPFISFARESARIGMNALRERPLALATTMAIPTVITAISQAMMGLSDDDMEDIRQTQRGKGAKLLGMTPLAGVPLFSMVIPVRTASGSLQQIDLSSTHPFADWLADRVENFNNQPWWQSWARSAFANPMLAIGYTVATGKDAFNDRVVFDGSYTDTEQWKNLLTHAYTTAVPPLAPGGSNYIMIEQATRRSSNKTMALRSPAQAVARGVFGVDVRTADPDIYRLADQFRQQRGLPAAEKGVAYPTDAAGRARKALFEELIQNQPNPEQVRRHLQTLNDLGSPVRTVADVLDILDRRRPDGVINPKALRNPFRASLNPEARRVLDQALAAFQRARANTPGAFSAARLKLNATTRRRKTTED